MNTHEYARKSLAKKTGRTYKQRIAARCGKSKNFPFIVKTTKG